ncbi:MAG TPA: SCO family protein [Streptosporangiaceae bacterium]|jgi:cytochrome oxidase Cu insertion factor (SCO1/SenC/PrrC family)
MNDGLNINDPTVVAAFKAALLHQGIWALVIFAILGVAWVAVREWLPGARPTAAAPSASPAGTASPGPATPASPAEPRWRLILRIGFGLLWIFDGILLGQPGMPVGLPSQVMEPTAQDSPHWVQHLVNWAGTTWSYHPIQAASGAVWIEVGIGIWLLVARRGPLSRLAGLVSFGWGLVVWVFGESFGGIFAPGLSWLTGAPGAAALYCVAGLLVALPPRTWRSAWLGRLMLAGLGVFLAGMAVLQAWPGRGFWQGSINGGPGPLASAVDVKSYQSQPGALGDLVTRFSHVILAHGFAVNLIAVIALALLAAAFLSGQPRLILPALGVLGAFCAAVWLQIQDLGFLGGLGTDPGSMIPIVLLAVTGYFWLRVPPEPAVTPELTPAAAEPALAAASEPEPETPDRAPVPGLVAALAVQPDPGRSWGDRLRLNGLSRSLAALSIRTVGAVGAVGVVLLGAVPMAAAQASPNASAILAQALDGSTVPLDSPAPTFTLTDQHGRQVALASLRGKAVLLTFLDPVCVTDCPLIAQEFREAGQLLGGTARHVALVAVNINPLYGSLPYIQAFDREEGLTTVPDWLYLTGTPAQLRPVWKQYGIASETLPAGSMLGHSDTAYAIDPSGRLFEELDFYPGSGSAPTQSSFSTELATAARQALTRT